MADAAFALKEGEVSAPVQGRFGTALVRVSKIEPEQVRAFEDVAAELKQDIATERAKAEMLSLYDKIEDERSAAQAPRGDSPPKLKLALAHDRRQSTARAATRSAKPVPNPSAGLDLCVAPFASDVGVDNDPLQLPNGGYVWYDVTGITPARERTLDEVKDQVEARWRDDEIAKRLKAKAADILDKLKAGGARCGHRRR